MKDPNKLELPQLRQLLKMSEDDEWTQDWDLIMANEDWVEDLISFYEHELLSDDEKNVLMQLIIASYDERLRFRDFEFELEQRLADLLKRDIKIHESTIDYWGRLHDPASDGWLVTPLVRKIWYEQENRINQK